MILQINIDETLSNITFNNFINYLLLNMQRELMLFSVNGKYKSLQNDPNFINYIQWLGNAPTQINIEALLKLILKQLIFIPDIVGGYITVNRNVKIPKTSTSVYQCAKLIEYGNYTLPPHPFVTKVFDTYQPIIESRWEDYRRLLGAKK